MVAHRPFRSLLSAALAAVVVLAGLPAALAQKGHNVQPVAGGCTASVVADWPQGVGARAQADGPCASANVTLTLTSPAGTVIWEEAYRSDQVFGLADAGTPDALEDALATWLGSHADIRTAGTLPDWLEGADSPVGSEFPFYIDEGVERARYLDLRAGDDAMVCYVQGMESARCLVIAPDGGSVESPGVQSFPG